MDESTETKYDAWLTDFCSGEPNVTGEADFSSATISSADIGKLHTGGFVAASGEVPQIMSTECTVPKSMLAKHGVMVRAGKVQSATLVCGTISNAFTISPFLGVGLTLAVELEKARERITELEAKLSTAQARIVSLESKPAEVMGDPDWVAPSTHFPRWY